MGQKVQFKKKKCLKNFERSPEWYFVNWVS